jgi:hypothetical protein
MFRYTAVEKRRAETGAKLLDEKKPGWEWHEGFDDLDRLDISKACDCVGGILFEDQAFYGNLYLGRNGFEVAMDELGLSDGDQRFRHGFLGHQAQTNAWKDLITARRAKAFAELEEGLKTEELTTA